MDLEKFGNHLRKLRIDKGLTQRDFSERLGVSCQAVSKWEVGRCMPDITTLKAISDILEVDISELLGGELKEIKKKKKNKKKYLIILLVILSIALIVSIIYFREHDFEFRTVSTTCDNFTITGSAVYSHDKTFIYISDVNYCGVKNESVYENITCGLYEKYGDTTTIIRKCDNIGEKTTLEHFLEDVEISADNYSAMCKKFTSSEIYLQISAMNQDGSITLYEIPITLEDNC